MKTWPLMAAWLATTASAAAPATGLSEHAPSLRLGAAASPSFERLRPAPSRVRRWESLVLPGESIRLALHPVAPDARLEARLGGAPLAEPAGLVPHAWEQSRNMVPDGSAERVVEVLTPPLGDAATERPVPGAEPVAVRLLRFDVPKDARPGVLSGEVRIDGRLWVEVRLRVLEPLPAAPRDPVLAFYRGVLPPDGTGRWPETVDAATLRSDLERLHALGATHVTYYGGPASLEAAGAAWRAAGFETEPLVVGWYPGPMARVSPEQSAEALRRVRALRVGETGRSRAFWVVDEPIREELLLARRKAALVREGGGLSTATLQVETAHALRHEIDLPLMDNYLSAPELFAEAVRSVRSAGSTPWGYWQSFGESERFARWNAGFRQLSEPTRGQCFYVWAHAVGDPHDDFDGAYRDMRMVYPGGDRGRPTLQLVGLAAGLSDLRLARGAQALVRTCRLDGLSDPAVSALERALARAGRRWSAAHSRWGRYSWDDVARPGRDGGPPASRLESTRVRILEAVAAVQAARREACP